MSNSLVQRTYSKERTRIIFFFLTYVFFIIFELHNLSAFHQASLLIRFVFKYLSFVMAAITFVLSIKTFKGKEFIFVCLLLLLSVIIGSCNDEWYTVVVSMLLVCSAKGIYYRSIIKCYFIVSALFCFIMVVGNSIGLVPSINYDIGADRLTITGNVLERKSFGYLYPTDFANHVFFIILCYWILRNGSFVFIEYLICLVFTAVIILYTDTKAAAICFVILLLLSVLYKKGTCNIILPLLPYSIPFFGMLSLFATIAFSESNMIWLLMDLFFSGRLHYQQDAFYDAGLTLFGQKYEMYSFMTMGINDIYNYVDSSYIQIIIFNGCLFFLFFIFAFYAICMKVKINRLHYINYAIMIAGLNGIFGQWFWQVYYCPFLLLLFSNIYQKRTLI